MALRTFSYLLSLLESSGESGLAYVA